MARKTLQHVNNCTIGSFVWLGKPDYTRISEGALDDNHDDHDHDDHDHDDHDDHDDNHQIIHDENSDRMTM